MASVEAETPVVCLVGLRYASDPPYGLASLVVIVFGVAEEAVEFTIWGEAGVLPRFEGDALVVGESIAARVVIHVGVSDFSCPVPLRTGDCGRFLSGGREEGVDCFNGDVDGVTLFGREVDEPGANGEFGRRKGDALEVPLKERGDGLYGVGVGGEDF